MLNNGVSIKTNKCWAVGDNGVYLATCSTSYRVSTPYKGDPQYVQAYSWAKHLIVFAKLNRPAPDSAIQPFNIAERLLDLFGSENIHLRQYPKFNRHFLFQSINKDEAIKLLTPALIAVIEKHKGLHIEIRRNEFIGRFERPVENNDAVCLIEVAEAFLSGTI
ncbi:hypothetical protein [Mucilaginibacter gilvus]|uniref:Uncharacterized protein n=1 Tax=Mucilaginibacter gilvus TaxID=2305909 RepID=A0A3S3XFL7_9SPHI|nr:hypothetical protein [Mucilaginibacter gilvus]RWY57390.1 hypothetical protein EPL05_02320 [Mucilaginibacter gilvus]